MRLSSVLVSLALLFCISSVSAQDLIAGTWYSPSTYKDYSNYCCIPTSVQITCSGSSPCTAYYKYPSSLSSKCWNMFLSRESGNLKLTRQSSEYYNSETTFFGGMNFNFVASNSTGYPKLNIYSTSSYSSDQCDFTMTSRTAPATGGIGGLIFIIIIFFIIAGCGGAKKYQMRQANVIIAQNLTQQPTVVTTYSQQPTVVTTFNQQPAAVIQVNQGFVQPQPTYIAPNQFPNGQVNMNFGGNAQFPNNGQVNMNMNFGANNGQPRF